MATTRKDTSKPAEEPAKEAQQEGELAAEPDQGIVRGGWDVGYRGDRVDQTPNEAYTVTGVLKHAEKKK